MDIKPATTSSPTCVLSADFYGPQVGHTLSRSASSQTRASMKWGIEETTQKKNGLRTGRSLLGVFYGGNVWSSVRDVLFLRDVLHSGTS